MVRERRGGIRGGADAAGEGAQGPTPAAIANAVYDAVGVRLRRIPFTPERVKAALEAVRMGRA